MKKILLILIGCLSSASLANAQQHLSKVAGSCPQTTAQVDLDVNNVRARILVGGDLWWDPVAQTAHYEVPAGSGINSIFAGAFWIGGIDNSGQLKVAAQTYRQAGANDYWGGPISKDPISGALSITNVKCLQYDRIWKINKSEVQNFIQGAAATTDMQQWPGNGDVANGELPFLAPFFDANNDGIYDYNAGDYPYFNFSGNYPLDPNTQQPICNDNLFGDQCLWWVFNDIGNIKTETNSASIGIEVRAQAFAYSSSDVDINNSTFYKYQIINRSSDSINNTHIGIWVDPDLGNGTDDYIGCDVGLNMGFVYNGEANDPGAGGYGLHPPALGIDLFQGPLAVAGDGIDNNNNNIIDEPGEQILMSNFVYYVNTNNIPTGNMAVTDDYFDYMTSHWLDGAAITYGGDGRNTGNGNTGVPCKYMFPGISDAAQTQNWTMNNSAILPDDMRFLMSAGSFTMAPGSVNYICYAALWARDLTDTTDMPSVAALRLTAIKTRALFTDCFNLTALPELTKNLGITIGPNPFINSCSIDLSKVKGDKITYKVYSVNGQLVEEKQVTPGGIINIGNNYSDGGYIIKFEMKDKSYSTKLLKL